VYTYVNAKGGWRKNEQSFEAVAALSWCATIHWRARRLCFAPEFWL